MKTKPEFCSRCGRRMEDRGVDHASYDCETGERREWRRWECERQRWWNLHSRYVLTPDGVALEVLA